MQYLLQVAHAVSYLVCTMLGDDPFQERGMSELSMSAHARTRLQQRGIPEQVLPLLMEFGRREYDHRGARVVYLTRESREKIRQKADKTLFRRIEPSLDVYAVLNAEGHVLTVGHRTRRINRN